jgi:hypothetical protein
MLIAAIAAIAALLGYLLSDYVNLRQKKKIHANTIVRENRIYNEAHYEGWRECLKMLVEDAYDNDTHIFRHPYKWPQPPTPQGVWVSSKENGMYNITLEKILTDNVGIETRIEVRMVDNEVTVTKSNYKGQTESTWEMDEAREILDMLQRVLD